ncbi:MAG: FtsQ-type POTRA domain-containing protein [Oscillospiraceae bacterium]|nr:FtsQ-type POTRA domain-containing protein [bacterium]MDY5101419.1 FtsQ-type POTRA domain-containing protein [Oscillospiraceae bacterium]
MEEQRNYHVRSSLYAPLALILIAAAAIVFLSLFFRVSIIQVKNDTVYTDEEIMAASGIEKGVNLLFINNFSAVSSIYATMPYVESVSLKRAMPNRIILEVTGSEAAACVSFGDDYWLINASGKLLEKIDARAARSFIRVEGMEPLQPVAGEIMTVSEENTGKDVFLYELLGQFRLRNIVKKIDWVDLSDLNDPRFSYDGRYTVILSSTTDLSRRLSLIESAIAQLAEGDAGTLELEMAGESSKVFFSPN